MLLAVLLLGCVDGGEGRRPDDATPTGSVTTLAGDTTAGGTPGGSPTTGSPTAGSPTTGSPTTGTPVGTPAGTGSGTTTGTVIAANAVADFALPDLNPGSPRYTEVVSPRDYLGQVSGWYFIHAT